MLLTRFPSLRAGAQISTTMCGIEWAVNEWIGDGMQQIYSLYDSVKVDQSLEWFHLSFEEFACNFSKTCLIKATVLPQILFLPIFEGDAFISQYLSIYCVPDIVLRLSSLIPQ